MEKLEISDIVNFLKDRYRKPCKTVIELTFLDKNDKMVNILLGDKSKDNIRKYIVFFENLFIEKDGYFVNKVSGFKFLNIRDYDGTRYNGEKRELPLIETKEQVMVNQNIFEIKKAKQKPVSEIIDKSGVIKFDIINSVNNVRNRELKDG